MLDELRRWVALADERMPPLGIEVLRDGGERRSVELRRRARERLAPRSPAICGSTEVGGHEMISCSYANPTPWASPRELSEDDAVRQGEGLADQLERPETAIFNLHVPPKASGLDTAYEIDDQLRIVVRNGKPHEIPVGSTAVRQLIEEYQPLLALHGHIHESRGAATIGRTLAINSGSEYATGRIHGVDREALGRRRARATSSPSDRGARIWRMQTDQPGVGHGDRLGALRTQRDGPRARHVATRERRAQLHPGTSDRRRSRP